MIESNIGCQVTSTQSNGIVPKTIETLSFDTIERNESIMRDMYNISERLKNIGMRLNSVNHPDNKLKEGQAVPNVLIEDLSDGSDGDGVMGQLSKLIRQTTKFGENYNKYALPLIYSYLSYIEEHI